MQQQICLSFKVVLLRQQVKSENSDLLVKLISCKISADWLKYIAASFENLPNIFLLAQMKITALL